MDITIISPMKENPLHPGEQLINLLETGSSICSIGVFDALSASIAAGYPKVQALFISGLGFTYSRYGWPDIGLIELTAHRYPQLFKSASLTEAIPTTKSFILWSPIHMV